MPNAPSTMEIGIHQYSMANVTRKFCRKSIHECTDDRYDFNASAISRKLISNQELDAVLLNSYGRDRRTQAKITITWCSLKEKDRKSYVCSILLAEDSRIETPSARVRDSRLCTSIPSIRFQWCYVWLLASLILITVDNYQVVMYEENNYACAYC